MLDRTVSPRQALAAAIAARDNAAEKARRLSMSASSAKEVLDTAAAVLSAYDRLEADITDYHARNILDWSFAGGVAPQPGMDLSDDLTKRSKERDNALVRLKAAQSAFGSLNEASKYAMEELASARDAVSTAADRVMAEEAEEIADALGQTQAIVDALRIKLRAVCGIVRPAANAGAVPPHLMPPMRKLPISARARDLAQYPKEPFRSDFINPEGAETQNWNAYHQRLLSDPDSTLEQSSSRVEPGQ